LKRRTIFINSGDRFGHLRVVEEIPGWKFLCLCDCGNYSTPAGSDLKRNKSTTCRKKCPYSADKNRVFKKAFKRYQIGAVRRGLEFNISYEQFCIFVLMKCQYCGAPPRINSDSNRVIIPVAMNGIDRVDSDKGYTENNIVPCCSTCNRAKGKLNGREYLNLCKAVVKNQGERFMPVEKSQKIIIKDWPDVGTDTNLDPSVQIVGETILKVLCDSSTCKNTVEWCLEKAGEDGRSLPDSAYRILILESFGGQKNVFCSDGCLRRWMKSYIPPLSPREKAEIESHNAALKPTVVTVPIPQIPGIEQSQYTEAFQEQAVALSQPDGFAGENTSE
jgi:hypothetical protein